MISVLIDHNIAGQAAWIWKTLPKEEWHAYGLEKFMRFDECGLDQEATDRHIYRFVQSHRMLLLTSNRNNRDVDSLERAMREEGIATSMPVITLANADRAFGDYAYRLSSALALSQISLDIECCLGSRRIYIPF